MNTHSGTGYSSTTTAPLLRVNEVAQLLSIGRRTVYTLVAAGELPAVRVGERLRFRPREIDAYLERNREAAP